MATVPGQLIWEIVKKNNSFLVKEFGNGTQSVVFSKESNNLYNLNSYKHSGNHHLNYFGINYLFYLRYCSSLSHSFYDITLLHHNIQDPLIRIYIK